MNILICSRTQILYVDTFFPHPNLLMRIRTLCIRFEESAEPTGDVCWHWIDFRWQLNKLKTSLEYWQSLCQQVGDVHFDSNVQAAYFDEISKVHGTIRCLQSCSSNSTNINPSQKPTHWHISLNPNPLTKERHPSSPVLVHVHICAQNREMVQVFVCGWSSQKRKVAVWSLNLSCKWNSALTKFKVVVKFSSVVLCPNQSCSWTSAIGGRETKVSSFSTLTLIAMLLGHFLWLV